MSISHEFPIALVDECPGQPEWLSHWILSLFGYMCPSSRTQFLYTVTLGMDYNFCFHLSRLNVRCVSWCIDLPSAVSLELDYYCLDVHKFPVKWERGTRTGPGFE